MKGLLIKNARVIDPANKIDQIKDILIQGSQISRIEKDIAPKAIKVIDATGKIAMPGIVDMHVHLREPGREDKETVESGTRAALKGGVTTLLAMPNTIPAIDSIERVKLLQGIIKKDARAHVLIAAAITRGRLGINLTDIAALKRQGAVAISDDGYSVDDEDLFLQALQKASASNILVISHCEDKRISNKGVINLGIISTRLGLKGIPREAEYTRVQRDIGLAKKSATRLHIAHVSCKESVEIIAKAKKGGVMVSAETSPHYFTLSEEAVMGYDTNMKINPPLRSREDLEAIKQGLKDKTIDAIASDHAPHTENEKDIEFERAEFGVIGLETELAVSINELIHPRILSWMELAEKLSLNPAKILGIKKGRIACGDDADLILVDPGYEWSVEKDKFISKSKNSCFLENRLKGRVEHTIYGGDIVYQCPA